MLKQVLEILTLLLKQGRDPDRKRQVDQRQVVAKTLLKVYLCV